MILDNIKQNFREAASFIEEKATVAKNKADYLRIEIKHTFKDSISFIRKESAYAIDRLVSAPHFFYSLCKEGKGRFQNIDWKSKKIKVANFVSDTVDSVKEKINEIKQKNFKK